MNAAHYFILELLKARFPAGLPAAVLPAVVALVADLTDGDAHLTVETRLRLQERIDSLTRGDV